MAKTFQIITQSGQIAAKVGDKTTIVNTSSGNIFITDSATVAAFGDMPEQLKTKVLSSLYCLPPNQYKSLTAGTYNIDFAASWDANAVIQIEN